MPAQRELAPRILSLLHTFPGVGLQTSHFWRLLLSVAKLVSVLTWRTPCPHFMFDARILSAVLMASVSSVLAMLILGSRGWSVEFNFCVSELLASDRKCQNSV